MGFLGQTWQLRDHSGVLLADLVVTDSDFPWLTAHLKPTAFFETVRQLFVDELAASGGPEGVDHEPDWEAADAAYERIRKATVLFSPDGPVLEFLLYIQDDMAWWRWSDELFTEG